MKGDGADTTRIRQADRINDRLLCSSGGVLLLAILQLYPQQKYSDMRAAT